MARTQYFVVLHDGKWKIKLGDQHYGPYASQAAAIDIAVNTANKAGLEGHEAQVLVQGEDHQFRTEWTYGRDPFPPKG